MNAEEIIVQNITDNFKSLKESSFNIPRERRITAEIPSDMILDVIKYANQKLAFTMLCAITGLDLGKDLQVIYHLANEHGIVLNLKTTVPKEKAVIETVTGIFQGASFYERELIDMFGFTVNNIPPGYRYPLPDDWPEGQYPLRKDWKQDSINDSKGGAVNNG